MPLKALKMLNTYQIRVLFVAMCICLISLGCSTNPATGKRHLNFIGQSREINLGNQAAPQFLANYGGPIDSQTVQYYVNQLGHRLADVSERPELPWEFHVVNSNQINAFALPGGKVFITRGLIEKLDNEAQLAGVLGHEIGHVTAQHIGQQMSRGMISKGLATVLGVVAESSDKDWLRMLGMGTEIGSTIYLLKFGRDQETEADTLGIRYMTRLGYNPQGQIQVMRILAQASDHQNRSPEFLATHPLPQTRIDQLEKHIRQHYPDLDHTTTYQFYPDRFHTHVLDEIKRLPLPQHGS